MSITIENVRVSTQSAFFTRGAGQLPMSMTSPAFGGGGIIDDPNLTLSSNDYYNMMNRDKSELEKIEAWNFADNNFSISDIDQYTKSNENSFIEDRRNTIFENPLKIPQSILQEANRYRMVYKNAFVSTLDIAQGEAEGEGKGMSTYIAVTQSSATQSLFNDFIAVNTIGMTSNVPLLNDNEYVAPQLNVFNENGAHEDLDPNSKTTQTISNKNNETDLSDCSIRKLVELSKVDETTGLSKLGMARYKWADFMYCKDLGRFSNNMLITLRRFPHPIGDNIYSVFGYGEDRNDDTGSCPDIGRMIAWLGDENKLDEIIKFSFKDTWKELHAEDEQQQSQSDDTPLGQLFNLGNPKYMKGFAEGRWGSKNSILGRFSERGNSFLLSASAKNKLFSNQGQYEGNPAMDGTHYDKNKVYTKQGTVQDTHIYEGKLVFEHSFSLTFNYQLRAYENINPKSAFLDLIGNILSTTYRKGTFWGGSRSIIGAPGNNNSKGWGIAKNIIHEISQGSGELATGLGMMLAGKGSSQALGAQMKQRAQNIKNTLSEGTGVDLNNGISGAVNSVKNLLANGGAVKLGDMFSAFTDGAMSNALGRPAVYAFSSLLTGDPVGLWHVTIGNPRNPILSMGNLIIDNTSFQMYGPLGIDDFPTGIKVTVSLKHAKPRDAAEIANMFTKGETSIVFKLLGGTSKGTPEQYLDKNAWKRLGTRDTDKILSSMASAT